MTNNEKIYHLEKTLETIQKKLVAICNRLEEFVKKKTFYFIISLIFSILIGLHGYMISRANFLYKKLTWITTHIVRLETNLENNIKKRR
jgi:hypothetical protein